MWRGTSSVSVSSGSRSGGLYRHRTPDGAIEFSGTIVEEVATRMSRPGRRLRDVTVLGLVGVGVGFIVAQFLDR